MNEGAQILTKTVYSTAAVNDRKATEPNANYTDYGLESTPLTTACSEAVFVGWTTAQTDVQGTTTSPTLVTFPYTISADATLYALWKITDTEGGGTATDFVKVTSTPSDWSGDYVIVTNAEKIKVTGKKMDEKIYTTHSLYVGGMKETTLREMLAKKPEKAVELAIRGMLPMGSLGDQMYTKLHVYAGPDHGHAAQKPEVMKIREIKADK